MSDELFYWVVTDDRGAVATVCEENALPEVKAWTEEEYFVCRKVPATVHKSALVVPPEAAKLAVEMRDLLWGPPDAPGPGKIVGKQQMLRDAVLELVRLLGGNNGEA